VYLIKFGNVPILWISKLQTHFSLMETKYNALSQSMRDLIPLQESIKIFKSWFLRKILLHHLLLIPKHLLKQSKNSICHQLFSKTMLPAHNLQKCRLSSYIKQIGLPYNWFRANCPLLKLTFKQFHLLINYWISLPKGSAIRSLSQGKLLLDHRILVNYS